MDININICSGRHIIEDWLNIDHRSQIEGVIEWKWGDPLPVEDNSASKMMISYGIMYAPKENYVEHLKDCYRALKSGGLLVIKEDDDRKRVWKPVGTKHFTGTVRSTSNEPEMKGLMEEAGFTVSDTYPEEFEPLLDNHRSARKNSYILTGHKL